MVAGRVPTVLMLLSFSSPFLFYKTLAFLFRLHLHRTKLLDGARKPIHLIFSSQHM